MNEHNLGVFLLGKHQSSGEPASEPTCEGPASSCWCLDGNSSSWVSLTFPTLGEWFNGLYTCDWWYIYIYRYIYIYIVYIYLIIINILYIYMYIYICTIYLFQKIYFFGGGGCGMRNEAVEFGWTRRRAVLSPSKKNTPNC